jgi:hypothetical protein
MVAVNYKPGMKNFDNYMDLTFLFEDILEREKTLFD